MKVMTLSAALLVIMSLFLLTPSARAQDTYDPGVDGYTYIDYDPDTDLVTAYSETDTDYDIACDYEAYVSLSVTDDSGAVIAFSSYRDYYDVGFASVEIDFYGNPDTTYTAHGAHKLYAMLYDDYWDYDYYPYRHIYDYYDDWYFGYFEGYGIYEPWYYFFESPYFAPVTRRSRFINMGTTYDEASVTIPAAGCAIAVAGDQDAGLSADDHLTFPTASQTLGFKDFSGDWRYQVEIYGTVGSDDASTWALHQKYTGRRKRVLQNADGSLAPQTNDYLNVPNDDPDPTFRQQTAGQPLFFWIDGPGHSKFVSGKQVSSLTQVQNFTSWAQKGRLVCRTTWYLKLVVQNGSIVQQAFGPGRASTNF